MKTNKILISKELGKVIGVSINTCGSTVTQFENGLILFRMIENSEETILVPIETIIFR